MTILMTGGDRPFGYTQPWVDDTWDAAERAVWNGVSLKKFLAEAEHAWREIHREEARRPL